MCIATSLLSFIVCVYPTIHRPDDSYLPSHPSPPPPHTHTLGDGSTYGTGKGDGEVAVFGAMRAAPIYAHSGESLVSVIDAGSLGIPVLKHLHHGK